jgi:hypothetical protein
LFERTLRIVRKRKQHKSPCLPKTRQFP